MIKKSIRILITLLLISLSAVGQVRLPKLISDGMVLQRDTKVKVWGWASPKEKVTVQFKGKVYRTKADQQGNWTITLPKMEHGGPYTMKVNDLVIKDILIGDVWVCSGQSNMELPMRRVAWIYEKEIAECENDMIREFQVPKEYDFHVPKTDLSAGSWKKSNQENIAEFSAVAYFFAKEINGKYGVPVGIINASLGGSPVESWLSEEALKPFPVAYQEMQKFKSDELIKEIQQSDKEMYANWFAALYAKDQAYQHPDSIWSQPFVSTADWKEMEVPHYWSTTDLKEVNGAVWFKKDFHLNNAKGEAKLILGSIVDADSVFINGTFVGTTSYQYPPRRYTIPEGVLKSGNNNITVHVINRQFEGGFVPDKEYSIQLDNETVSLEGIWKYKVGVVVPALGNPTFIQWQPGGLYNGMIAPLHNYTISGVLWYQGESNTGKPNVYQERFAAMIGDWRKHWQQDDFPFLYVQLANFLPEKEMPSESNWARLRDEQRKTMAVDNTGMAVIIDIGEWNDIHPLNKKEVGHRLSLWAQQLAYKDKAVTASGPLYKEMEIQDETVILSFLSIGDGLVAKDGQPLRGFTIAGSDRQFVKAEARIEDGKVIVWHKDLPHPVAVRYAWADNPGAVNFYNKAGLPASPFRTDNWDGKEN
ncbi:sialate O-acetylesterase [Limibacter armeniacum]|uniref:sialate O-acetylesterase n=1 Tax=Limibacter armeniacum TaxID=466084 RepID=UPI002FE5AA5C